MIRLPKDVSVAIERYWSRWDSNVHYKHIKLTDWTAMYEWDVYTFSLLLKYAKEHPIEYMTAMVEGYEIEGDGMDG